MCCVVACCHSISETSGKRSHLTCTCLHLQHRRPVRRHMYVDTEYFAGKSMRKSTTEKKRSSVSKFHSESQTTLRIWIISCQFQRLQSKRIPMGNGFEKRKWKKQWLSSSTTLPNVDWMANFVPKKGWVISTLALEAFFTIFPEKRTCDTLQATD